MPIRLQETASELQEGDKIISELAQDIDNGSKTYIEGKLSHGRIDILKKTLKDSLPTKVLAAENVYQKMRSERGESILSQDYDDIRGFLKHQVLKELYDNANNELVLSGKEKDTILTEQSEKEKNCSEKLTALKKELDDLKIKNTKLVDGVSKSDEYKNVIKAYIEKSQNEGAVTVLNDVLNLLITNPSDVNTADIESRINNEEQQNLLINNLLNEITSDTENNTLTEEIANISIIKINSLLSSDISTYAKGELRRYLDALLHYINNAQDLSRLSILRSDETHNKLAHSLKENIASQRKTLQEAKTVLEKIYTQDLDKVDRIQKLIDGKFSEKSQLENNVTTAEAEFKKKLEEMKVLANQTQEKALEVGNAEGALNVHQTAKKEAEALKKKINADGEEINKTSEKVSESEKKLINSQKLRINAKDLIVREEPKKDSNRMREHNRSDLKELSKLQPGNMVTPVLDKDGNLITEKDGDRIYVKIIVPAEIQTAFPPYTDLEGWIALSDKIGGKYKQEYVDLVFEQDLKAKEYQLTTDGVRLRTGFNTNADIIDTLKTDKIKTITRVIRNEAGDSAPEGSGLKWYEVAVTYKDGSTKTGYIAEKYLKEKVEVIEGSSPEEAEKAIDEVE